MVGSNGAGKTTLLRLIAGELSLDRDDKRQGKGVAFSRRLTVGYLKQEPFSDKERTVEEELLSSAPGPDSFSQERFAYEKEYDVLFTGFGFSKADKKKKLKEFSGGEQTKIALIRHFLLKPDLLLLDEPTNHLDLQAVEWLEQYLKTYEKAVVMVSHDRFFLDRTVSVVYELSGKKLTRYPGNYTRYREEKTKAIGLGTRAFERQQEELKRLNGLVERFKNKPTKASFARAKRKAMEQMVRVEKPEQDEVHLFTAAIEPAFLGSKWVFEAEHLKIGYDKLLLELSIRIRRGQKIGILGPNGAGKTTFLKTAAGLLAPLSGKYSVGNQIVTGYFDQHCAEIHSSQSVAGHFGALFPSLTQKELRSALGAYLFGGREAEKRVDSLSGGEKSRLVLAELLHSRPNFLILDEPTNHMDIRAKETLESAFRAYQGTLLFVSHDRYFLSRVAESILVFTENGVLYYPFGYEHYLEQSRKAGKDGSLPASLRDEEQALVAGLRAVPKAERHRLQEIPEEEAYVQWKMRLVLEKMIPAGERVGELWEAAEALKKEWMESEGFWQGKPWENAPVYEEMLAEWERAWGEWNGFCLEWYDVGVELGRL